MHFDGFKLDERLQRAVQAAGYTEATAVQEAAIPHALEGRDLVGTAQTGTGKTAAFVLPLLQSLLTTPARRGHTRALIVTPTRELAEQINAAVRQLAKFTKIKSATVYGGVGFAPQERALRQGTDIIVACPGRLLDHVGRGNARLGQVEILVLDEADRMLDMGFLPPVRKIAELTSERRQTMMFSATFAEELNRLSSDILTDPERIEVGLTAPATTIAHTLLPVASDRKMELLLKLLEEVQAKSVLIFLGVPLVLGLLTSVIGRRKKGDAWYEQRFLPRIGPWALYSLLFTITLLFAIQGDAITSQPLDVARIAVPFLLYFALMWTAAFAWGRGLNLPYPKTATLAFTAAGNNFELAIAVAIGTFGVTSGQALAGVVGPLIEVPVLVALVYVSLWGRRFFAPSDEHTPSPA